MKKYFFLASLIAFSLPALSDEVDKALPTKPPVRTQSEEGWPIPTDDIPLVYDKDCDPNGWRFNIDEWLQMCSQGITTAPLAVPRYYRNPINGSNGGYEIG